jgi:hypothetical protein
LLPGAVLKRAIVLSGVAVLLAAVVIFLLVRARPAPPSPSPDAGAEGTPTFTVRMSPAIDFKTPRPRTDFPPPPGYQPSAPVPAIPPVHLQNPPVAAGELPLTPPLFDDPNARTAFKKWWKGELTRRIGIYERLEPDHKYPGADAVQRLLDDYYDAAEPRRPGESIEDAQQREQAFYDRWNDFLKVFGAPMATVSSRAGDPQYGATPEPPVKIPGAGNPIPPASGGVPASSLDTSRPLPKP